MSAVRSRWAAIGAAVAVTLGAGAAAPHLVGATSTSTDNVFVPITPCRITDTRADAQVGPRGVRLGADETHTVDAHGTNGRCTIPSDAVALSLNVTALGATAPTFLTLWPSGADRPEASSLNPSPGAPPTPNAVTTSLSHDGKFAVYNLGGTIDVIIDVNGYYVGHDHDDRYYTKSQADSALAAKANTSNVYTKSQVDAALGTKADASAVYTTSEVDALLASAGEYVRTVVVNSGGTPTENGAALIDAITSVTAAAPSATEPWAIVVEPGRYEAPSFPPLPGHTTLRGFGRDSVRIVDTDSGPTLTASDPVAIADLTVEQSGTAVTATFTDDVEMTGVRVISASNASGLQISGSTTVARLVDVLIDDDDPTGVVGNIYGLAVKGEAVVDLVDSEITGIYGGVDVGTNTVPATLNVRGGRIDTLSTSISADGGTVTVDGAVLTHQITLGGSTYTADVDVVVRNSTIYRFFFNGSSSTGARSVTVESSTMTGGVDGGAGDGATSATLYNTHTAGTVNTDTETCVGVSGPAAFFATTCP
jgi:hypothetical protein